MRLAVIAIGLWSAGDKVRLVIDGTLGSEFFQEPTVDMKGEVETVIGDPLPIPD